MDMTVNKGHGVYLIKVIHLNTQEHNNINDPDIWVVFEIYIKNMIVEV